MKKISILFLFLFCCWMPAGAADLSTPEGAAAAATAAMTAQNYDEYVSYMHPDALAGFRKMMMEIVDLAAEKKAESQLLQLFDQAKAVGDLAKLNDRQFFTSFLKGVMAMVPMMKEAMSAADLQILGHVNEGDKTAHVVARLSVNVRGAAVKKMSVISLQRDGDTWKMLLSGEMEGLAKMLKAQQEGD